MVLPALVLWPESGPPVRPRDRIARTTSFVAASAAYLVIRVSVLGGVRASGGSDHLQTALRYLAPLELEGLLGALWPRRLYLRFLNHEMELLSDAELGLLAILLVATLGGLWALRRRAPVFAWGILWFGLGLAPAALIAGMLWPGFGRYLYLPSVGLAASIGSLAYIAGTRLPRWRVAQLAVAVVYLAVLGTSLRAWAQDFRDVETLYSTTITRNPKGPHAYGWLGIAYRKQGLAEEAIGPLTIARQLAPDVPRYTHHLIYALVETKQSHAARDVASECVRQHPTDAAECQLLLYSIYQMSDPERAVRYLLDCIEHDRKVARCQEAYDHALSAHPLKERYRELARED
jgi:tetratricopeptide (TPR) repeat protein